MFITFEGGEGTGKSTQVSHLAGYLREQGRKVVATREPGGTRKGEALRKLLLNDPALNWSADEETLLNYAARAAHLQEVIRPALADGVTVVCDRFMDSTRAYQGFAGGGSIALIDQLEAAVVGNDRPDLTFVFDLDPEIGLQRARARGAADRFESRGMAFHTALRQAFAEIARANPQRCRLIDASLPEADVTRQIRTQFRGRL